MTLEEKIRNCRKQVGISQEKMAELIGVSRQAITKWENGTGTPDIANLVAIAKLFQISLDELLLNEKREKKQSGYLYESSTEYDIDGIKNYDIKLGSVHTVILSSSEGEKIEISLLSNIIKGLQSDYKIKIDDIKNRIDVDLQRLNGATEADAKESMVIRIDIPQKYIGKVEVAVNAKKLELMDVETWLTAKDALEYGLIDGIEENQNANKSTESNDLTPALAASTATMLPREVLNKFNTEKNNVKAEIEMLRLKGEEVNDN